MNWMRRNPLCGAIWFRLESEGVLRRVYGGAMAVRDHGRDGNRDLTREQGLDFDWQSTRQAEEKRLIAAKAAGLIEDRQTIILDGGSTVAAVAQALRNRSLHVITNSLPIALALEDARQIEVTLTGGYLISEAEGDAGSFVRTDAERRSGRCSDHGNWRRIGGRVQ